MTLEAAWHNVGHGHFIKQAIADPEHPEHGDMRAWIGRPFDPNAFVVQEAQERLNEIKL